MWIFLIIGIVVLFIFLTENETNDITQKSNNFKNTNQNQAKSKPNFATNKNNTLSVIQNQSPPVDTIPYKINLIRTAISENKNIHFSYTDMQGEHTQRTVQPQSIEYRHKSQTPCMRGFCHLRQEYRTFVIRKMTDIIIK